MESAVNPEALTGDSGQLAGRPLEEWNAAYVKVENYFHALRVRNKALLGQLVLRVLDRAMRRAPAEPDRAATQLAAEEMTTSSLNGSPKSCNRRPPRPTRPFPRAGGWRCCWPTCRAGGRNNFCAPGRGRRNSPLPCARPFCAPARISSFPK